MILVSACLLGKAVRYDGGSKPSEAVSSIIKDKKEYLEICPEYMGGLKTPREPAEIVGGSARDVINGSARVMNAAGEDVTAEFLKGAQAVLKLARETRPEMIYLKANSPSCGAGRVYDGSFTKRLTDGNGITAELLIENGFSVTSV